MNIEQGARRGASRQMFVILRRHSENKHTAALVIHTHSTATERGAGESTTKIKFWLREKKKKKHTSKSLIIFRLGSARLADCHFVQVFF